MSQLVRKSASLAHRPPSASHRDVQPPHFPSLHGHAVLVDLGIEYCDVGAGGLFDQRYQIAERMEAEMVVGPEALGGCPPLGFGAHPTGSMP